jgi:hypothetical protein
MAAGDPTPDTASFRRRRRSPVARGLPVIGQRRRRAWLRSRVFRQLELVDQPSPQVPTLPDRLHGVLPTPCFALSKRVDQHVDPSSGTECNVSITITSTGAAGISNLWPRPGAITKTPSTPASKSRARQRHTVSGIAPHRRAISWFATPSAASNRPALAPPDDVARPSNELTAPTTPAAHQTHRTQQQFSPA